MNNETNFFDRLNQKYHEIRDSEKRVADYILKHPEAILNFSITELARESSVSEATVNRLCHSLGYSGYGVMKIALSQQLAQETIKNIPKDIKEGDDVSEVAKKLSYSLKAAIENTYNILSVSELVRAIESIQTAERIYFYGIGGSGAVAKIAHHLFLKAGILNYSYEDGYMQAVSAALLTNRDVVVGISHSGNTKDVVEALHIAKERGATTIAITGNKNSAIVNESDISLFTFSNEEPIYGDFMEAKVSQVFIIDLLYIGILLKNIPAFNKYLEETAKAVWNRSFQPSGINQVEDK